MKSYPHESHSQPRPASKMNSLMTLILHLGLLVWYILPAIASTFSCNFPAIINFGDSNSDTGGLSATFGPTPPPYGETFFQKPVGRWSDGRLIVDFIAESFGLPLLSSYLDSLGTNFSHGANFATDSSTIIDQNISLSNGGYSPFFLTVQRMQFSQFIPRSQSIAKRGGFFSTLMPKAQFFRDALYTIDIGQNDLTAGLFAGKSTREFIPRTLVVFSDEVQWLYQMGARYFWIHNTAPLGCLAYTLLRTNPNGSAGVLDQAGCAVYYNRAAQLFNKMLKKTLAELEYLLPFAVITYVDVYSAKYSLFLQPEKYGFEDPLMVCCGYGGGKYNFDFNISCGEMAKENGSEVLLGKSCDYPSKKVVWDGVHYTEAANKVVFDLLSTGRYSYPFRTLSMACIKNGSRS